MGTGGLADLPEGQPNASEIGVSNPLSPFDNPNQEPVDEATILKMQEDLKKLLKDEEEKKDWETAPFTSSSDS